MNTRKQVLIMSALMLVSMIVLGAYAAWYPSRETAAAITFEDKSATRGAATFAQNCRLCHGDVAEGGALGARLPAAPALDRPDLQGYVDAVAVLTKAATAADTTIEVDNAAKLKAGQTILISTEKMNVKSVNGGQLTVERAVPHGDVASPHQTGASVLYLDPAALKDKVSLITNTITCGRIGTPMPAWAQSQSGPLSDEQIRQLMTVITTGRWDLVKEDDDSIDLLKTTFLSGIDENTISMKVTDVRVFNAGDAIRIGDERLRVTAVPKVPDTEKDKRGIVQIDRGILGTAPLPHTADELIYKFPETAAPAINQSACGQTAKPTAVPKPPTLVEPFSGQTVSVAASGIKYNPTTLTVSASGSKQFRVRLDNQDKDTQHNIAFYKSKTDLTPMSTGDDVGTVITGTSQNDSVIDTPAAGTYFFRCDIHPDLMQGTLTVTP
jgi:plastocyanin